jgi:GNAT superfamily N-acetyltransferase
MDHSVLRDRHDGPVASTTPGEIRRALAISAVLKPVAFDNLSDVRYLHAHSLKQLASGELTDEEFAQAKAYVYSSKYLEGLGGAVRRNQFFGAWIGDALVGTAGWSTMLDHATVARIRSIFVSPLYARLGLAQRLLAHVEGQAAESGLKTYSVRSMTNASGFFVRQGYTVTSHGTRALLPHRTVPVTFLRKAPGEPQV